MDLETQRKVAAILRVINDAGGALGSPRIARELGVRGIDLKARMIRYYLDQMDDLGFTENLGRRGRRLTESGKRELESAVAVDRVGFVSARVDQLAFSLSFDVTTGNGTVILNASTVPVAEEKRARSIIGKVLHSGLGMGRFTIVAGPGDRLAGTTVGNDKVGIGTVCSVTLNGVLCSRGIPTTSRYGGLLEMRDGRPERFTQLINYEGTTIDPMEIFIKGKMTRVRDVVRTGAGTIGASFREIPAAALPAAREAIAELDEIGLGGVLAIGVPGRPVLDIPVPSGRVGFVVAAGLNPIAAVHEACIPTENHALAALVDFVEFAPLRV
jgi:repressor of nif and glnA expression